LDAIQPHTAALIRKLEGIAPLAREEAAALLCLPMRLRDAPAHQDIIAEGDTPSACCMIVEGFACRYNLTAQGRRQILSFHISGDVPDLQSLHLRVMNHSLGTLIPSKLAFIQHDDLRRLMRSHPRLGDLAWRDTLIDDRRQKRKRADFCNWVAEMAHPKFFHMARALLRGYDGQCHNKSESYS
jgi:CRP-like cAMP-binding protein